MNLLFLILISIFISACGEDPTVTIEPTPSDIVPSSVPPTQTTTPASTATKITSATIVPEPSPTIASATATSQPARLELALAEISEDSILAYLQALTTIESYSGWRNSASAGEAAALDFISGTFSEFDYLGSLGLDIERQSFPVFLSTEIWTSEVSITVDGTEIPVQADAIRGHRHNVEQALLFDSDGSINDSTLDPIQVEGQPIVVRTAAELLDLEQAELADRVVLLDYQLIQPGLATENDSQSLLTHLINSDIAGLLLVTTAGDGNGKYIGGGRALENLPVEQLPPILYLRLEDLKDAGIRSWSDLGKIQSARIVWDTDVFLPGSSGNLVVKIPGQDPDRTLVLGAHIDSANSPGAIDNGINSAALIELARVLDQARIQPAYDLYLVWFGSEELWIYGSQYFVNTYQDVLDRALAVISMDAIIASTPGDIFILEERSHERWGSPGIPFADTLAGRLDLVGIPVEAVEDSQIIASDDAVFSGFSVQSGFAFGSEVGKYAHSPYDTFEIVQNQQGLMEKVVSAALAFVLADDLEHQSWSELTRPERQAYFIATHTEVMHMSPPTMIELDRAFAWAGYDVDIVEYGRSITAVEMEEAGVIVALPSIDYRPGTLDQGETFVEWSESEIDDLVRYVEQGGLLLLTNSANRILFENIQEPNEDWEKMNDLAARFGITFFEARAPDNIAEISLEHPLTQGISSIGLIGENSVGFVMEDGQVLASVDDIPVVGLVEVGDQGGGVIVIGDVGLLGYAYYAPPRIDNHQFLVNLAAYANNR